MDWYTSLPRSGLFSETGDGLMLNTLEAMGKCGCKLETLKCGGQSWENKLRGMWRPWTVQQNRKYHFRQYSPLKAYCQKELRLWIDEKETGKLGWNTHCSEPQTQWTSEVTNDVLILVALSSQRYNWLHQACITQISPSLAHLTSCIIVTKSQVTCFLNCQDWGQRKSGRDC